MERTTDFLQDIGQIKDEKEKLERLETEIKHQGDLAKQEKTDKDDSSSEKKEPSVIVNIEKGAGYRVKRDENGDMEEVLPLEEGGQ